MTIATATPATGSLAQHTRITRTGPIVVATDGTPGSDAAVRAAAEYARQGNEGLTALAVLPPAPIVATEFGVLVPPENTEHARRHALEQRVRDQSDELLGGVERFASGASPWRPGDRHCPGCRSARCAGGLHRDRAPRPARPTLRRRNGAARAPHVAGADVHGAAIVRAPADARVIGTDFSRGSLAAARTALDLFPGIERLHLAHVAPRVDLQNRCVCRMDQ